MPDSPRYPDTGDQTAFGAERVSTSGMPRWAKVAAIVVLVLVVLVVVMLLVGGGPGGGGSGGHGPRRH